MRTQYKDELTAIAKRIIEECTEYDADLDEAIDSAIYAHEWFIDSSKHDMILAISDNKNQIVNAADPAFISATLRDKGIDGLRAATVFYAMRQDLRAVI